MTSEPEGRLELQVPDPIPPGTLEELLLTGCLTLTREYSREELDLKYPGWWKAGK
jgi:hypothetical protein